MSLKEDIQAVKEELSAEEQFLENTIKIERFWHRYRKPIIGVVAALILGGVAYGGIHMWEEHRISEANAALIVLLNNPTDQVALEKLKANNQELYAAFALRQAVASSDSAKIAAIAQQSSGLIGEIAKYEAALATGKPEALARYAAQGDALLKELALIEAAAMYLDAKEPAKAKQLLLQISMTSPLRDLAAALEHLCVTGL
ncbi:MAG: hypothetical protein K6347_01650 [Campylobacterales bacterium]